ncbi:MAG: anti-sigma-D factor RsdA, partial [Mycobacteriaceae bacterium]
MSDVRRPDPGPEPTLEEIRRTDDFLDALAAGQPAATQDSADAALAAMLGGWRDEMRWPPDAGLISESQALAALDAGLAEKPRGRVRDKSDKSDTSNVRQIDGATSRRNRRGLSVVGAVAAAALCIGGFGAVVAGAGPGDALYGLRTMLFGTPKQVRDDQVALAARTEMQQVQQLISQGDWEQAQQKLVAVSTQVASVGDEEQKQQLLDQFNDLSAKVVDRNPEATAAPGIVYTVPPSATDLVPVLAPTTTSGASPTSVPSLSESTTAPATTTPPSSGAVSTTAPASAATSSPTTASPTTASPTTASSAQSSAEATTSAAPRTSTTSATTAATPTTTPTSAAPTTTAATTA